MSNYDCLNRLDDICLLKVFSYLPYLMRQTLKKTCKKWSRLIDEYEASLKNPKNKMVFFCESNKLETLIRMNCVLKPLIHSVHYRPKFILTFLTESCRYNHLIGLNPNEQEDEQEEVVSMRRRSSSKRPKLLTSCFDEYRKYLKAYSCPKYYVFSSGVVCGGDRKEEQLEIESFKNEHGISSLLFAKKPQIRIKQVNLKTEFNRLTTKNEFEKVFDAQDGHEEVSFLLVFITKQVRTRDFNKFFQFLSQECHQRFVISGGCVDEIHVEMSESELTTNQMLLLGFISLKNSVQIRQTILEYCEESSLNERVDACKNKLKILKESIKCDELNEISFAIQVSCIGRGRNYYSNEESVECRVFKEIFPKVQLIGFFGYGELGHEHDEEPRWMAYSSVFTLFLIKN